MLIAPYPSITIIHGLLTKSCDQLTFLFAIAAIANKLSPMKTFLSTVLPSIRSSTVTSVPTFNQRAMGLDPMITIQIKEIQRAPDNVSSLSPESVIKRYTMNTKQTVSAIIGGIETRVLWF